MSFLEVVAAALISSGFASAAFALWTGRTIEKLRRQHEEDLDRIRDELARGRLDHQARLEKLHAILPELQRRLRIAAESAYKYVHGRGDEDGRFEKALRDVDAFRAYLFDNVIYLHEDLAKQFSDCGFKYSFACIDISEASDPENVQLRREGRQVFREAQALREALEQRMRTMLMGSTLEGNGG